MPNRRDRYSDMDKFLKTRNKQRKKYYAKTAFKYESRLWTGEEDELIMTSKLSDTELSDSIHRSVGAIQKRRCSINKKLKDNNK